MMGDDEQQVALTSAEHAGAELISPPLSGQGEQQVDIHKPKAVHSWREFFNEIGIIVIGVLIALGAEQLVETVHLRSETREALHGIRTELSQMQAVFEERHEVGPCLNHRLEELGDLISAARKTHRLPEVGEIGRPFVRPFPMVAWVNTAARGLNSRLSEEEQNLLPIHYSEAGDYARDVRDEQEMWATLRLLEHSPGPVDSAILAKAATALEKLRFQTWLTTLEADELFAEGTRLGIAPQYSVLSNYDGEQINRKIMQQTVKGRSVCQPLSVNAKPFTR